MYICPGHATAIVPPAETSLRMTRSIPHSERLQRSCFVARGCRRNTMIHGRVECGVQQNPQERVHSVAYDSRAFKA
jgi:hypothetical protein